MGVDFVCYYWLMVLLYMNLESIGGLIFISHFVNEMPVAVVGSKEGFFPFFLLNRVRCKLAQSIGLDIMYLVSNCIIPNPTQCFRRLCSCL